MIVYTLHGPGSTARRDEKQFTWSTDQGEGRLVHKQVNQGVSNALNWLAISDEILYLPCKLSAVP